MIEEQTNPANHPEKNLEAYKAFLQLDQQEQILKAKGGYLKSYVLIVFLPPIGLYYFLKYFFFAERSFANRKAAMICLALTVISLILNIWIIQLFFSQFVPAKSQNLNFLEELITPENQKTLQQLMQ